MDRITIKNFRVFNKEISFDLAPVTILTGENNSGKSSLIKAILLINDYVISDNQLMLKFNGENSHRHKLGNYWNTKNDSSKLNDIKISFNQSGLIFSFLFKGTKSNETGRLELLTVYNKKIDESLELKRYSEDVVQLIVSQKFLDSLISESERRREYRTEKGNNLKQLMVEEEKLRYNLNKLNKDIKTVNKKSREYVELINQDQRIRQRLRMISERINLDESSKRKGDIIYNPEVSIKNIDSFNLTIERIIRFALHKYIEDESNEDFRYGSHEFYRRFRMGLGFLENHMLINTYHLGPNRIHQSRLYFDRQYSSEINEIINQFSKNIPKKGTKPYHFLHKWLKLFDIGEDIIVERVEETASYVYVKRNNKKYNLVDLGFGAGQILTILLKVTNIINLKYSGRWMYPKNLRNHLILIEEPESNLHPKLQSYLADFFYESAEKFSLKFIIESHSEYLVRKIQKIVKEKHDLEIFKIYYFDKFKYPYLMRFREDGKFIDEFGPGFFDESANLAFEIL